MIKKRLGLVLCLFIILLLSVVLMINSNKTLKIEASGQKFNESFTIIYEYDDEVKVYSQFTEVYVYLKNDKVKLSSALSDGIITMDNIIMKSDSFIEANDGGTKTYIFNKEKLSVVYCKTLDGINDIYITDINEYDGVCKKR